MEECGFCGASGGKVFLFDVISDKGIIKICRDCYKDNKMPLVKKEKSLFRGPEEQEKVYERLAVMSGYVKKEPRKINSFSKTDVDLRKVVEKNFMQKLIQEGEINPNELGLARNFHWKIMRARRLKHFTQKQLAEAIEEPEIAIKSIEFGKIPRNGLMMIRKIENCLGINLAEEDEILEPEPESVETPIQKKPDTFNGKTEIDFEEIKFKRDLTISDLQELKKRKRAKDF